MEILFSKGGAAVQKPVNFPKNIIFIPKYVDLRVLSSIVASRIDALLSSNPPECQDWGAGQANLGNARILRGFCIATPPYLDLVVCK